VLDVRERGAYERGHIFRSISLPRRLIAYRLASLVTAPETALVLCDDDGSFAPLALPLLGEMGFRNVQVLEGGLAAWRAAGGPLVQGINVPSKVFGEHLLHERRPPEIDPSALKQRIVSNANLAILDVRTPEEYRRGCIPGAVSVPGAELVLRIRDLVPNPAATIVVHCGGRTRSYVGAESLRALGLPNPVFALKNGTMGWQLAGFDLERGADRRAGEPSAPHRLAAEHTARRIATTEGVTFVSGREAVELWQRRALQNVYLVDVRSVEEHEASHAAGAIAAPGGQVIQAGDDYFAVRAATYVFMCDGITRAAMTAAWFRRMGAADVLVLDGGLAAWQAAGGALAKGAGARLPFGFERAARTVQLMAPRQLQALLSTREPAWILGVDSSDVYARGHVAGAQWACASRIEAVAARLNPGKQGHIAVTCTDGVASTLAAEALLRAGYGSTVVLAGGTTTWAAAGLPVECGLGTPADIVDDVVPKPYDRGRDAMLAYLRWEEALHPDGTSAHDLFAWEGERTPA
jgi:rhodanese-related sulfurtransferase